MDHCDHCDACSKPLTLSRATCVTNTEQHLHADSPECVERLEKQLNTFA